MTNNLNDFLNKILLGDSLEYLRQLPSNSIDAVITDPPYCSGGTTAVAAKMHNRNFVGFEKTKVYHDIALERLEKLNMSK